MKEGKKNMELYFDEKIKNALNDSTSEHFTSNVMHKVFLEMQFAKEDKKTEKMTFKFIGAISVIMVGFFIIIGYILTSGSDSPAIDSGTSFAEDFTITVNKYLYEFQSLTGFTFDMQTIFFILSLLLVALLYSASDRFIFKKR